MKMPFKPLALSMDEKSYRKSGPVLIAPGQTLYRTIQPRNQYVRLFMIGSIVTHFYQYRKYFLRGF